MGFIPGANSGGSSSGGTSIGLGGNSKRDSWTFVQRPSIGLRMFGPLVPASDCRSCLWSLVVLQTGIGLAMFTQLRSIWHRRGAFNRIMKLALGVSGSYTIFNSGLEISRLMLPYDPWCEEAAKAREMAKLHGKPVNHWFGPWDLKPMSFNEWSDRIEMWIREQEDTAEYESIIISSPEFQRVYSVLRENNLRKNSEILSQLKKNQFSLVFNPSESGLRVPDDNELQSDLDLLEVWEMNDPWTKLGYDCDIIVKFTPRSMGLRNALRMKQGKDLETGLEPELEAGEQDHD